MANLPLVGRCLAVLLAGLAFAQSIRAYEELGAKLSAHIGHPRFRGAVWGVKIVSLDTGRTLFEHGVELRLSPASNCKLYAGALALARLGSDYRIVTPLLATAAVDSAGELPGDLIVAGRGDPSWNPRPTKAEFWSTFDPFVAALREAGVRRIRGDVVADATWLRAPPHGAGWTADDLNDGYGAEVSAVSLANNFVELRVTPGAEAGGPCAIEFLQPLSGLVLDNRTVTTEAGSKPSLRLQRLPGERTVQVFGGVAAGGKVEIAKAPVPRPAQWFAEALKEALLRSGIVVDGSARSTRWPEPRQAGVGSVRVGELRSPPMRELVASFMRPSQNLETDLVFDHVGELRRTPETHADRRSDELAVDELNKFMTEVGIGPGEVIFEEGSGLSRNNMATASATVRLLEFMAVHPEAAAFIASLPVAGRDGTLDDRMKETAAEGNVQAKTGSLRWAASLSGYVKTARGERLAFSLMLNRHLAPPESKTSKELDEIAVLLASLGGSEPREAAAAGDLKQP